MLNSGKKIALSARQKHILTLALSEKKNERNKKP